MEKISVAVGAVPEMRSQTELLNQIAAVRNQSEYHRLSLVLDQTYAFDQQLKQEVLAAFGATRFLQQVPAWQALVGGTIESPTDITPLQHDFIESRVAAFVAQLSAELGLD